MRQSSCPVKRIEMPKISDGVSTRNRSCDNRLKMYYKLITPFVTKSVVMAERSIYTSTDILSAEYSDLCS